MKGKHERIKKQSESKEDIKAKQLTALMAVVFKPPPPLCLHSDDGRGRASNGGRDILIGTDRY